MGHNPRSLGQATSLHRLTSILTAQTFLRLVNMSENLQASAMSFITAYTALTFLDMERGVLQAQLEGTHNPSLV